MLMRFHITKFKRPLKTTDFIPTSEVWPLFWGKNHGPDVTLEPELWLSEYNKWLETIKSSQKPLLRALLDDKKVSNGLGEWQGTDVLARAALHPLWTAARFAACVPATNRLKEAIIDMDQFYTPKVGMKEGDVPFISVLNFEAKDGIQPSPTIEKASTKLQVFVIKTGGKSYYTHLEAFPEEFDQAKATINDAVDETDDIRALANSNIPTLGPYSFQLFHSGRQTSREVTSGRPAHRVTMSGAPSTKIKSATQKSSARYRTVPSTENTTYHQRLKRKQGNNSGELSPSEEEDFESEHSTRSITDDTGSLSGDIDARPAKSRRKESSMPEVHSD
ncbi:hypothetical protein FRC01_009045 [Tulasnella sp. 417]|nr:hypothetical protein FRC01_009045 [Tulasnella sp. 417]